MYGVPWYTQKLDSWGKGAVRYLGHRSRPDRIYAFYRKLGFDVYGPQNLHLVPDTVVERYVSGLRRHWRRWLVGEALTGAALGPFGVAASLTGLSVFCLQWGIEMGWAYGLTMDEPRLQDELRLLVAEGLTECMGLAMDKKGIRSWLGFGLQLVLLALGQDLAWADRVMGVVRHRWRVRAGRLTIHPKIMAFRHNTMTVHPNSMAIEARVAHNGKNSTGSSRRYAT
ncbi:MAG: hypothetical protein ACYCT0_01170 [Sulfobacillus sp.]